MFLGAFAVPAGKGKLKKMSIWTSSIYIAPATAAAPRVISIENRFIMDLWYLLPPERILAYAQKWLYV